MKFCRRVWHIGAVRGAMIALAIMVTGLVVRAELSPWAQETIAVTTLEGALFRLMALPDGAVMHFRPAWEARAQVTKLIQQGPKNSELYAIRAREEERMQDYSSAEADWKQAAAESKDKQASLEELADFYQRRVKTNQELDTLLEIGALPEAPEERFQSNRNGSLSHGLTNSRMNHFYRRRSASKSTAPGFGGTSKTQLLIRPI